MPNSRSAEQIGQAADDYLAGQIGRLDDELQTMKAAVAEEIAVAVERGLMRAVGNPALWKAASVAMRAQAQSAAGGWLLGGMRAMFTRAPSTTTGLSARSSGRPRARPCTSGLMLPAHTCGSTARRRLQPLLGQQVRYLLRQSATSP